METVEWRKKFNAITIPEIITAQKKDKSIQQLKNRTPDRIGELFDYISNKKEMPQGCATITDPTDRVQRILIPKSLQKRLIRWYHRTLLHPGEARLHATLKQHFTWPKMREQIHEYCLTCKTCQQAKRGSKKYGKIPLKDVEECPWKDIALDLAGPWDTTIDNEIVTFHTLTIIDVFTGWVEVIPITTKITEKIGNLVEQEWLRRYPKPKRIIFDSGGEFDSIYFRSMCKAIWKVDPFPITVKNPRANAIVERMHQILGTMIRAQLVKHHPKDDPIADLCSAAAYAIRSTVHGTTQYTPGQLVFNKDMILRTNIQANVELVRHRRAAAIESNNRRENKRRIAYDYKAGDKVLILSGGMDPKLKLNEGPYKVISFDKDSGTLQIQKNHYIEPINIRRVRPYFGHKQSTMN